MRNKDNDDDRILAVAGTGFSQNPQPVDAGLDDERDRPGKAAEAQSEWGRGRKAETDLQVGWKHKFSILSFKLYQLELNLQF